MVTIELDKTRTLKYTWGSIRRLKQSEGIVFSELTDDQLADLDVCAALLWAGLVHEDESLTVSQVADMVPLGRTREITDTIAEAINTGVNPPDPTKATA